MRQTVFSEIHDTFLESKEKNFPLLNQNFEEMDCRFKIKPFGTVVLTIKLVVAFYTFYCKLVMTVCFLFCVITAVYSDC